MHRLPSGRLAVRFETFYTVPSPALRVWLSRAEDPRSTLSARRAPYVDAGGIRSDPIAIWDEARRVDRLPTGV